MGTKVGIVYATQSGILRRYIYPTDDTELASPFHVGIGEAMLIVDQKVITNPMDIWIELSQHLGKVIPDAKCAVLDKQGNVVDTIMADPVLDNIDNHTLIANSNATVGDTFVAGNLIKKPVIALNFPPLSTVSVA